ncbi:ParB/RepB/Spo0J family partition protein [Streptomyces sp. AV19]|uniref:ParB/RepB/Spo0J family partition protein n=1 Tax=Streptomyces sp. AV19 TaxID=2793068 RepID=UPI0018FEBE89|nr:ParB/RepB/Spo0J family partition protein [Streptomyces sp. AV19]MBH1937862.1 ParB/RepB/Spo0J family partition protein [Streptomyces sp. AV19]MDG4536829.1 ParB/RepB/Spo0J family partition protein [Streptomyces sp. AV19]
MAGRRTSLASLAGQKVDDVPGRSDPLLLTLPLDKLVPTRFNPRRNFGSEDDLKEFGEKLEKRQLQPAVVVSRAAYLKLWPDEAPHVGTASYVIANGERRYRASQAASRKTLDVVHNEDVAKSRADFLDAVLAENNDREDLDPIERALGIETMVNELGGADKVAEHYGKTKGWVSQQRKLLKLTAELQDLVSSGDMPVRVARDIAGLPASDQQPAWEAEQQRRAAAQRAPRQKRAPKASEQQSSSRFTAVNQKKQLPSADPTTPRDNPTERPPGLPAQTSTEGATGQVKGAVPAVPAAAEPSPGNEPVTVEPSPTAIVIPSRSPADVVETLAAQLSPQDLAEVAELLLDQVSGGHSAAEAAAPATV